MKTPGPNSFSVAGRCSIFGVILGRTLRNNYCYYYILWGICCLMPRRMLEKKEIIQPGLYLQMGFYIQFKPKMFHILQYQFYLIFKDTSIPAFQSSSTLQQRQSLYHLLFLISMFKMLSGIWDIKSCHVSGVTLSQSSCKHVQGCDRSCCKMHERSWNRHLLERCTCCYTAAVYFSALMPTSKTCKLSLLRHCHNTIPSQTQNPRAERAPEIWNSDFYDHNVSLLHDGPSPSPSETRQVNPTSEPG